MQQSGHECVRISQDWLPFQLHSQHASAIESRCDSKAGGITARRQPLGQESASEQLLATSDTVIIIDARLARRLLESLGWRLLTLREEYAEKDRAGRRSEWINNSQGG